MLEKQEEEREERRQEEAREDEQPEKEDEEDGDWEDQQQQMLENVVQGDAEIREEIQLQQQQQQPEEDNTQGQEGIVNKKGSARVSARGAAVENRTTDMNKRREMTSRVIPKSTLRIALTSAFKGITFSILDTLCCCCY